jgi:ribulose-phosphate 3-epimerase
MAILVNASIEILKSSDRRTVPNISIGAPVVTCLRKAIPKGKSLFDCHMMVSNPRQWIKDIADAGGDQYCFHYEAVAPGEHESVISEIRKHGMKVGIAVKPGTDIDVLYPLADKVDMALVMTVEPGFGGQKFMADMMPKVNAMRQRFPNLNIEVDGGLGPKTVDAAAESGANVIVAGSSCFGAPDPKQVISVLRQAVDRARSKRSL